MQLRRQRCATGLHLADELGSCFHIANVTYNVSKTKHPAFGHYFAKYGQILDKFSELFHWQIPNDTFCISAIDIYYKRVALRSLLCSSNSLVISYGMWVPVAVWQCYFTLLHFTTSIRILTNWPTDWLTDEWLIDRRIDWYTDYHH